MSVRSISSFLYHRISQTVGNVMAEIQRIGELEKIPEIVVSAGKTLEKTEKTKSRPFTVLVEGNIGSGKTTFLQHFSKFANVDVMTEPVNKWRNLKGSNLLQKMYEDPGRWSLTFQTYVQLTMLEQHVKRSGKGVKIMERSIYSAKYCFVENLYKSGKMPGSEYEVLSAWFRFLVENPSVDLDVDLIIYLKTSPDKAMERIKSRSRGEEHLIPMSYVNELHDLHEDWLTNAKFPLPAPVVVIDANKDLGEMVKEYVKQETVIFGKTRDMNEGDKENEESTNVTKVNRDRSRSPLREIRANQLT